MSPVRNPLFRVSRTAASILLAAFSCPRPYFKSIAALRIVANGFALSCTLKHLDHTTKRKKLQGDDNLINRQTNLSSNIRSRTMYRFKKTRSLQQWRISIWSFKRISKFHLVGQNTNALQEISNKHSENLSHLAKFKWLSYQFPETSRWKHPNASSDHWSLIR